MDDYSHKVIRKHLKIYGAVQGVGFRYRAVHASGMLGTTGWVKNNPDGTVSMEIQGTEEQIDKVLMAIDRGTYVDIQNMDSRSIPVCPEEKEFKVQDLW